MSFEEALITWYHANRRHMAWRDEPSPYRTYVSEIMLQQTQVETVRPYFERFMAAFPTIAALAAASEEEVLKRWEGLGYYSRGRNLHKSAQLLVKDFAEELPSDKEALLSLPGVGDYTARAILALAFHQKEIAVDGNLLRVYARLNEDEEKDPQAMKPSCEIYLKKRLLKSDPSEYNQALMDLGEMVCLPHTLPRCDECPLRDFCQAQKDGTMLSYPFPKEAKEKRQEEKTVFLLRQTDKIAIRKRPSEGLLASLYEFPSLPGKQSPEEAKDALEKEGFKVLSLRPCGAHKHVFSHLVWEMQGYEAIVDKTNNDTSLLWVEKSDLRDRYPIPSAFAYFKKKLFDK